MGYEPRHPGDAKDLEFISRAPTDAPVSTVRDVLLVPTTYVEGDYPDEVPAGDEPIDLGEDLRLARLSSDDVELVLNACTQRGHYFVAVRQFGQRYSFVRAIDPAVLEDAPYGWDDGNLIFFATVLSRLIHDNGHSLEYAARIVDHEDGSQQVIPVNAPGFVATSRLRRGRDWLTADEADGLRQLLADYLPVKEALPWKVSHALNVSEEAIHLQIFQRALLLIATGLEGLVQSDTRRATRQFCERLPLLAAEVGVDGVDEEFADALYTARSQAAHGARVSMFQVEPKGEQPPADEEPEQPHGEPELPEAEEDVAAPLALAQDLLRAATRRAIQDPAFRQVFESEDTVRAHWPVEL
jgi:hypothetical protein